MKLTYEELEKERNELAAKVERLRIVATESQDWDWLSAKERAVEAGHDFFEIDEMQLLWDSVHSETQPSALAALKAHWQADILESTSIQIAAHDWFHRGETPVQIATVLLEASMRIRQRTKETGDDRHIV